jgi:hypothetical protein
MSKAVYLVYFSQAKWWVDLDGKASGPFLSKPIAIAEAIQLAQAAQQGGRNAEVLAPGDDKRHHVAWPAPSARSRAAATASN